MEYHLVAARCCTTANGLWCFGVGWTAVRQGVYQNIGYVAAYLHGACVVWVEGCVPGGRAVPACYYWRWVVWHGVMFCQ
jgi:hypothetical protein